MMTNEMLDRGKWSDDPKKYNTLYNREWLKKYPWKKHRQNIMSRCNKQYKDKGIECRITSEDLQYLWYRDEAYNMESPAIHRIDNDDHYTIDNCVFMERSEHTTMHLKERHKQMGHKMKEPEGENKCEHCGEYHGILKCNKEPEEKKESPIDCDCMVEPPEVGQLYCKVCGGQTVWHPKHIQNYHKLYGGEFRGSRERIVGKNIRDVYNKWKDEEDKFRTQCVWDMWNCIAKHCEVGDEPSKKT